MMTRSHHKVLFLMTLSMISYDFLFLGLDRDTLYFLAVYDAFRPRHIVLRSFASFLASEALFHNAG